MRAKLIELCRTKVRPNAIKFDKTSEDPRRNIGRWLQFVDKAALLGFGSLDYWNQVVNEKVPNNDFKTLNEAGKPRLIAEISRSLKKAGD